MHACTLDVVPGRAHLRAAAARHAGGGEARGGEARVLELVHESATNRATCSTSMNRSSSRSHAMLLLRVTQAIPPGACNDGGRTGSGGGSVAVRHGLLSIVDLAGSERVCKSGSEGTRLEEAKRINKSIAALGNCIAALATAGGRGAPPSSAEAGPPCASTGA